MKVNPGSGLTGDNNTAKHNCIGSVVFNHDSLSNFNSSKKMSKTQSLEEIRIFLKNLLSWNSLIAFFYCMHERM